MQKKLLNIAGLLFLIISIIPKAEAKIWRLNNTAGVNADFKTLTLAFSNVNVLAGDTIYIEGSDTKYDGAQLKKKLVIIGPGYNFGLDGNPNLQYNDKVADVYIIMADSLSSGSTFLGLSGRVSVHPSVDDLTISRCNISWSDYTNLPGALLENISITKSIINIFCNNAMSNLYFANNIVNLYGTMPKAFNSIIRNNVINSGLDVQASYVANNIFIVNNTPKLINCTVKNNLATHNILPSGNNNQNNISATDLFVGGINIEAKYQLKEGSLAIGYGETINNITPDAGIFGTADPYRLSGIPPLPTINLLTVPENVPASATKMTITFSTRTNN